MTVLFIHGTGVRKKDYEFSLRQIKSNLENDKSLQIVVEGGLWGDPVGTKLEGKSIPNYRKRKKHKTKEEDEESIEIELWSHLYSDSLYELRVLAIGSGEPQLVGLKESTRGEILDGFAKSLTVSAELQSKLKEGEIDQVFEKAKTNIIDSEPYQEMLKVTKDPMGVFQMALARAIVAESIILFSKERSDDRKSQPVVGLDATLRNKIVRLTRNQLGSYQAPPDDWVVKRLWNLSEIGMALGTPIIRWGRNAMMDAKSPIAADVLFYQSNCNERIRDLIHMRINEVKPPVILVGHSLGGIASFDLLVDNDLTEKVKLLITVGSQIPYLYEINALRSLEYGKTLPPHLPPWINIYDLQDFLSFVGEDVFPNGLTDREVNNMQPFPKSHDSYWSNPQTYEYIIEAIREHIIIGR